MKLLLKNPGLGVYDSFLLEIFVRDNKSEEKICNNFGYTILVILFSKRYWYFISHAHHFRYPGLIGDEEDWYYIIFSLFLP